ncbi:MAG: ABC transporter permease [Myxococcales bacterium]|nr:ABC transporter permease [Myxococcales bacterium]
MRRPLRLRSIVYQLLEVRACSLPLTLTMSAFAGMVLAFQVGAGLERFGAELCIGQTTVTALFRELGPILTALFVGGRIGAGITAELGGMAVCDQNAKDTIDQVADKAKAAVEKVSDAAHRAAKATGGKLHEAAKVTGEKVSKAANVAGASIQGPGKKVKEAGKEFQKKLGS